MLQRPVPRSRNLLLAALPEQPRRRLLSHCMPVRLAIGEVLYQRGATTRKVYFPTSSFISLIAEGAGDERLEVGMIGEEGMLGASLVLGVAEMPARAQVQGTGEALELDANDFLADLRDSSALRQLVQRYLYVQLGQLARSAVCTRFHVVESRLARWLLMTADRAQSGEFHLTHEFLAYMLGVRRAGVTGAAASLQERGLIRYRRGNVTIVDRRGLTCAACGCYAADRDVHKSVLS